ncbi:MAG: hypothetical protein ABIM44_03220 [candidate division WOR-3 bacterium]
MAIFISLALAVCAILLWSAAGGAYFLDLDLIRFREEFLKLLEGERKIRKCFCRLSPAKYNIL